MIFVLSIYIDNQKFERWRKQPQLTVRSDNVFETTKSPGVIVETKMKWILEENRMHKELDTPTYIYSSKSCFSSD